ncbi:hypothetical protein [Clostridium sp.]|uniref:hypothetical protein n=1 Tax=Clostridium sp. TaxID=1506 RepID=UPI0029144E1F|nr:hypothetical protein [Clostridium sp.]MDU6522144.1 hypothetical protein [Clostridium sp.]
MTIIMVYIATHLSYGIEIYNTFKLDGITIFDGVKSIRLFLDGIQELKKVLSKIY